MLTQFTITKRIAKHGEQAVIIIPKILEEQLKPGTIVEINLQMMNLP
jgi:antitoxin component of MazEF toxin-antitoxin module